MIWSQARARNAVADWSSSEFDYNYLIITDHPFNRICNCKILIIRLLSAIKSHQEPFWSALLTKTQIFRQLETRFRDLCNNISTPISLIYGRIMQFKYYLVVLRMWTTIKTVWQSWVYLTSVWFWLSTIPWNNPIQAWFHERSVGNRGPLTRCVNLRVAHAPGMLGTFSSPRTVMHVGIANPRRWGKRPRNSRYMRNPQCCVSGKRPMVHINNTSTWSPQGYVDYEVGNGKR